MWCFQRSGRRSGPLGPGAQTGVRVCVCVCACAWDGCARALNSKFNTRYILNSTLTIPSFRHAPSPKSSTHLTPYNLYSTPYTYPPTAIHLTPYIPTLLSLGAVFLGPTKHTSDMHAFQPVVPSGSQRTWCVFVFYCVCYFVCVCVRERERERERDERERESVCVCVITEHARSHHCTHTHAHARTHAQNLTET